MAQFRNIVPTNLKGELLRDMMAIRAEQETGALPRYETFVQNLMKTLPTPAEELHHAGTGMAGEAGEVLEMTKKVWVYGAELDLAKFIKELGDMRFYYQAALNMLGITDEEVRAQNMKKLRVRYADGNYSDAAANARVDTALSAEGSKGSGTPEPRKFMGQTQLEKNIHDKFDAVRNESIRQLRKDEGP